jgi:ribulose-phosphate 3-epimerase
VAINPATPVDNLFDHLPYLDMVLIMSVDPGFYGQAFMESALGRIRRLKQFQVKEGLKDLIIAVDGGINLDNIGQVVSAGASLVVAGSAAFTGGNVNERVHSLREAARS